MGKMSRLEVEDMLDKVHLETNNFKNQKTTSIWCTLLAIGFFVLYLWDLIGYSGISNNGWIFGGLLAFSIIGGICSLIVCIVMLDENPKKYMGAIQ